MSTPIEVMPLAELTELVNLWGTLPCTTDGRRPLDGREQTALADELHPVFAATDDATRAHLVTALLEATGVRPTLTISDGADDSAGGSRLVDSWTVADPGQGRRAAAALALRHHLSEHPARLGVCADHQCADVYIDSSPAGRRRFCCITCQNRARAAAFRRRHRSA